MVSLLSMHHASFFGPAEAHAATEIGEAGPGGEMLLVTFTAASTNALGMADKRLAKAKLKP